MKLYVTVLLAAAASFGAALWHSSYAAPMPFTTVTHDFTVLGTDPSNGTASLAQFDPNLGTPTRIDVRIRQDATFGRRTENINQSSGGTALFGTVNGGSGESMGMAVGFPSSPQTYFTTWEKAVADWSQALGVYDLVTDYAGTSGASATWNADGASGVVHTFTGSDVNQFVGTGNISIAWTRSFTLNNVYLTSGGDVQCNYGGTTQRAVVYFDAVY